MQTWPAFRNLLAAIAFAATVHVGVVEDDHRRVAAELHRHPLHVLAGERGELLADDGRAGERDLADHRMRDQVRRDLGRVAVDEADRARRHAGVDEGADQLGRRAPASLPAP